MCAWQGYIDVCLALTCSILLVTIVLIQHTRNNDCDGAEREHRYALEVSSDGNREPTDDEQKERDERYHIHEFLITIYHLAYYSLSVGTF